MVNKLVVQADLGRERINRNIYGRFSEHLGVIFKAAKLENNKIFATLPAKSVVVLEIE